MSHALVGIFPNLELANNALREIKNLNIETSEENIVSKETNEDYSANGLVEDQAIGNAKATFIGSAVTHGPLDGTLAAMHPDNLIVPPETTYSLNSGLIQLSPPLRYDENFQALYDKGYTLYSLQTSEKNRSTVKKIFKAHRAFSVEEL